MLGPSQKELFRWQGIIKDAPESHVQKRARKKFDQLDVDSSGYLDGKEIDLLAEWVWSSFHPDKKIDSTTLYVEANKLRTRCDRNRDGKVGDSPLRTCSLACSLPACMCARLRVPSHATVCIFARSLALCNPCTNHRSTNQPTRACAHTCFAHYGTCQVDRHEFNDYYDQVNG